MISMEKVESADQSEEDPLMDLLQKFDLVCLMPYLKEAHVTYRTLRYIKKEDLIDIIPLVGPRIEFREKLFAWRKEEFGVEDETLSMNSKVQDWLKKICDSQSQNIAASQSEVEIVKSSSESCCSLAKDLKSLLMETAKGQSILESYNSQKYLTDLKRNSLIDIIVEDALFRKRALSPKDFSYIVDEISQIFPTEKNATEYYFIPRRAKKNPSGKLYAKYVNMKCKKAKMGYSFSCKETHNALSSVAEYDESMLNDIKDCLKQDTDMSWNEITDKWEKSFILRQSDLKKLQIGEFLSAWPKYKDPRFPNLINIDFELMHPKMSDLIHAKWETFKDKIKLFYENNIHNEYCKQLFEIYKSSKNKDTQDYISCTLLNAVLPSNARFKSSTGKNHKKLTISDTLECFAVRVASINDYLPKLEEVVKKYFSENVTIQPFLIVEGQSDEELNGFYIYFDTLLYQFDSFIQCFDTCFKMYNVLSIKYPKPCEPVWVFIQQFFFDINSNSDFKSSNLTSLLHFMKNNNLNA